MNSTVFDARVLLGFIGAYSIYIVGLGCAISDWPWGWLVGYTVLSS
jgi:hypothetical protein